MCKSEYYKHNLEFAAIEPILEELGICRDNVISSDCPDIIIKYKDNRKIGIEVIACVPLAIQSNGNINSIENENRLYNIVNDYQERIKRSSSNKILSVMFVIDVLRSISKEELRGIDKIVIEEIDAKLRGERRKYNYIECAELLDVNCNEKMSSINIDACFVEPIDEDCVRYCIDKKEIKLRQYKDDPKNADINEYWLVIHFMYARKWRIDKLEMKEPVTTGYSRVYLTQYSEINRVK